MVQIKTFLYLEVAGWPVFVERYKQCDRQHTLDITAAVWVYYSLFVWNVLFLKFALFSALVSFSLFPCSSSFYYFDNKFCHYCKKLSWSSFCRENPVRGCCRVCLTHLCCLVQRCNETTFNHSWLISFFFSIGHVQHVFWMLGCDTRQVLELHLRQKNVCGFPSLNKVSICLSIEYTIYLSIVARMSRQWTRA